jgi:N12 class adenine-specific DNA methylase
VTTIDHPHFALILLKSLAKDIEKKNGMELETLRLSPIKVSLHELLVKAKNTKTPKFDNDARIPTPDPREITVLDEEWFKRRRKPKKGYQEWKF